MSSEQDQARLIAERVARRVAGTPDGASSPHNSGPSPQNGGPVREEISAIREGLHVLENKLERIESKIVQGVRQPSEPTRARVIDFVSTGPPLRSSPAIESPPQPSETGLPEQKSKIATQFVPATHSPWLRDFNNTVEHASQERFGIEEATVTELVEFFENEKKCSVEPGGKPCDHCAMCSSRGF
ncbi:MAG TPA: hypothetical protein VEM96_11910 [Pyrinomonadaceae bacterium]|nr:hypothetical protein [Pyrinomonadaceae bacterium]